MARPVTRPTTYRKTMNLDAALVDEAKAGGGDRDLTHLVEDGLRLLIKAQKRAAKKAPSEA